MNRIVFTSLLAACSHGAPFAVSDASPPREPTGPVPCETTTTCTFACDSSQTFTTIGCESVESTRCTSSSDESESYGCTLACDHEARVVDHCDDDTR